MKNLVALSCILLLAFPAFVPWMPHGTIHALHDHSQSHHASNAHTGDAHEHGHTAHEHDQQSAESTHHAINLDVVTYFNDYLHVDLRSADQVVLAAPAQDTQDIDFTLANDLLPQQFELASVKSRGPPPDYDWRQRPSDTPLYLSTQRLRI